MAEAADTEKLWQSYKGRDFVALGIDVWNGTPAQVRNHFRRGTGTTYPLLLEGSAVARSYGLGYEDYIVIDHRGIIRYRPAAFGISLKAVRSAIDQALAELPGPAALPKLGGEETTPWGAVKTEMEKYTRPQPAPEAPGAD